MLRTVELSSSKHYCAHSRSGSPSANTGETAPSARHCARAPSSHHSIARPPSHPHRQCQGATERSLVIKTSPLPGEGCSLGCSSPSYSPVHRGNCNQLACAANQREPNETRPCQAFNPWGQCDLRNRPCVNSGCGSFRYPAKIDASILNSRPD